MRAKNVGGSGDTSNMRSKSAAMPGLIQRARDILAKWREEATAGQWIVDLDRGETFDADDTPEVYSEANADSVVLHGGTVAGHDIRLIVGTAGNLALLDAIDGLLDYTLQFDAAGIPRGSIGTDAERIAAAIIAADERMSA